MADSTVPNLTDGGTPLATDLVYAARSPYVAGNDRYLSVAEIMASIGQANPMSYSAVGNGVADDTAAVTSAITVGAANGNPVFLPGGTFKTTLTAGTAPLVGPIVGNGQLIDNAGNKRGKIFDAVTSKPATVVWPGTGIDNAYNGDLTHVPYAIERRLSGADTNGTIAQTSGLTANAQTWNTGVRTLTVSGNPITAGFPSSGTAYIGHSSVAAADPPSFVYTGLTASSFTGVSTNYGTLAGTEKISTNPRPYFVAYENYPILAYVSNSSGRSGVGSQGRTGAGFMGVRLSQESTAGGDIAAFWVSGVASGVTGGATRWDQNSSIGMWAGGILAGADGVYLDADELQVCGSLAGTDYDVAAAGIIRNFTRNNDTGALGTWWNGLRFQSLGSKNVDVGMMLYGTTAGYMVGIDMSAANLPASGTYIGAAITMSVGQRIYLNASGTDSGGLGFYRRPDSPGTEWIEYTSLSGGRIDTVVGGGRVIQASPTQVTVGVNFKVAGSVAGDLNMGSHKITSLTSGTVSTDAAALANTLDQFASLPNNTSLTGKIAAGTAVNLLKIGVGGAIFLGDTSAGAIVIPNAHALQGLNSTAAASLNIGQVNASNIVVYGDSSASGVNIVTDTTTGLTIATATSQKVGFFGSTPVVQQAAATDLGTVLSNYGLRVAGTAYPITTSGTVALSGGVTLSGAVSSTGGLTVNTTNLTLTDVNIALSTATGTRIGTGTTQKLSFFNATPVAQQSTTGGTAVTAAGSTNNVFRNTTFPGATGSTAYTIGDIVTALKNLGLMAA